MKQYMFNRIITRCASIARSLLVLAALLILSCSQQQKSEFESKSEPTTIELPDGTAVHLRAGARLIYADDFGNSDREVMIIGEGYFEVKHDPRHPFIAHCHGVAVTVLGTAFNIRLSPATGEVEVTVTEGKVNVSDARRNFGDLLSHRQVVIDPANHEARYTEQFDMNQTLAWFYEGLATGGDRGLGTVIAALELRYGVRIKLENPELQDCKLKTQPDFNQSLDEILQVFVMTVNAKLIKQQNTYIIRGGHCN